MTKKHKLDNIDIKIIKILSDNAKISNVDLSKKAGISPSPCLRRVKILEEAKVIKSYGVEVDFGFLEYDLVFFASISTNFTTQEEKDSFQKELFKISEILEIYLLNNEKDYLVKFIVKNYLDYKVLVNTKLARIPFIKNIRTTKINDTLKKSGFF